MGEQPGNERAKIFKVGDEEVRVLEGDDPGTEAETETVGAGVSDPVVTVVAEPVRGVGGSGGGAAVTGADGASSPEAEVSHGDVRAEPGDGEMGAAPSTLDVNVSEVTADVDDGKADVNVAGDAGPGPMPTSRDVGASADVETGPGVATAPEVDTSEQVTASQEVDTSPDSRTVEAGPVAADVNTSAESPQSRDVGAGETEADKSTGGGASDGNDDDDMGAGPDGGRVRLGEETSSSIRYSQEITSPEEEPEREGRSLATTHHEVIKQWAEERGGTPATVDGTEHGDHLGVLRLDFSGDNENLRHVSWEEWFDTFDARRLNFIYQEQRRDGRQSNFFRLESPDREDG